MSWYSRAQEDPPEDDPLSTAVEEQETERRTLTPWRHWGKGDTTLNATPIWHGKRAIFKDKEEYDWWLLKDLKTGTLTAWAMDPERTWQKWLPGQVGLPRIDKERHRLIFPTGYTAESYPPGLLDAMVKDQGGWPEATPADVAAGLEDYNSPPQGNYGWKRLLPDRTYKGYRITRWEGHTEEEEGVWYPLNHIMVWDPSGKKVNFPEGPDHYWVTPEYVNTWIDAGCPQTTPGHYWNLEQLKDIIRKDEELASTALGEEP